MFKEDDGTHGNTLCENCQRACGGCSWSSDLKPVSGWVAIKTKIKRHHNRDVSEIDSYQVLRCPLFKLDDERHTKRILLDRTMSLVERIVIQAVRDYARAYHKTQTIGLRHATSDMLLSTRRWLLSPIAEEMLYVCGINIEQVRLIKLIEADPLGVLERININYESGGINDDYDD